MAGVVTTTTINRSNVWGDRRAVSATLAFDTGDYAAGGIVVTPGQFGLQVIDEILFMGAALEVAATPTASVPQYNRVSATSHKIRLFDSTTGAPAYLPEHAASAMGSGATLRCLVIGY
jgi:hypothetical protein